MSSTSKKVKKRLMETIAEAAKTLEKFTKNPTKDFTRERKLSFETVVQIILQMEGGSLQSELLKHFDYSTKTVTSSAFVQARAKILPKAFQAIFEKFQPLQKNSKNYHGYRVLAHDGSDINIPKDPGNSETYQGNGVNLLHLNALYDVMNKIYVSADLQGKCKTDERESLCRMCKKLPEIAIIIADRGYESCNVFEYLRRAGQLFLIRAKDVESNGILAGLDLPKNGEFDVDVKFWLSRRQTKEVKQNSKIKFLSTSSKFDFLPEKSKDLYEMNFRVVRVKVGENNYESLITNLPHDEFSPDDLKELYHMRWGVETSFRELKYALGLSHLHAKIADFIEQEIFAKLTMYNFCMAIACAVAVRKKPRKWGYQVNFTRAIEICKRFFGARKSPPDVEALIEQYILPIRENRCDKRNLKPKSFVGFLYRVA